jgi:hypothetical protein
MLQNINIEQEKFNELTNKLGMSKEEVNDIIMNILDNNEISYLSSGPPYCSTYYGSVSIKDF